MPVTASAKWLAVAAGPLAMGLGWEPEFVEAACWVLLTAALAVLDAWTRIRVARIEAAARVMAATLTDEEPEE